MFSEFDKRNQGPVNLPGPDLLSLSSPAIPVSLPDVPFLRQHTKDVGSLGNCAGLTFLAVSLPFQEHNLCGLSFPFSTGRDVTRENPFMAEFENFNHFPPPYRISEHFGQ